MEAKKLPDTTENWEATSPLAFPELFLHEEVESVPVKAVTIAPAITLSIAKTVARAEEPPFVTVKKGYPRIAEAIETTWGHRELDDYLQRLIVTNRGEREGFPGPVLAALMKLSGQHALQFSFDRPGDMWSRDPMAKHAHRDVRHVERRRRGG
jgi:hypothetical protein